jgi:hypothetical protein
MENPTEENKDYFKVINTTDTLRTRNERIAKQIIQV